MILFIICDKPVLMQCWIRHLASWLWLLPVSLPTWYPKKSFRQLESPPPQGRWHQLLLTWPSQHHNLPGSRTLFSPSSMAKTFKLPLRIKMDQKQQRCVPLFQNISYLFWSKWICHMLCSQWFFLFSLIFVTSD